MDFYRHFNNNIKNIFIIYLLYFIIIILMLMYIILIYLHLFVLHYYFDIYFGIQLWARLDSSVGWIWPMGRHLMISIDNVRSLI